MKKLIFLLLFLSYAKFSKAQIPDIPFSKTYSTKDIAEYVKQNFADDKKKLHAIYTWVASTIKYDTDSANIINIALETEAKITAALRRRRGVCENYAAIFNDICLKAGLTSYIIEGYTKQNGAVDKTGHVWCAVFIDNTWLLCDPTWDKGGGTKWFLVQPSEMIASHMPFDPMWQLLDHPFTHNQFSNGNMYTNKSQPFFNYGDSITAYGKMDSLQRFRSSAVRIEQSGLYNALVKDKYNHTKMHIEIIREEKDVDLYNSSVADLNNATNIYNNFIEYRNKQFTPAINDDALQALLKDIDKQLSVAHKKLDEIDETEATFKFSTEAVRDKLNILATRVKEQKDFLIQYINASIENRLSLFYSRGVTTR